MTRHTVVGEACQGNTTDVGILTGGGFLSLEVVLPSLYDKTKTVERNTPAQTMRLSIRYLLGEKRKNNGVPLEVAYVSTCFGLISLTAPARDIRTPLYNIPCGFLISEHTCASTTNRMTRGHVFQH
jgi:hypothetical protein